MRILIGILSGHCKVNGHLSRLEIAGEAECRFRREKDELSIYLPSNCSSLSNSRVLHLGACEVGKRQPNLGYSDILHFLEGIYNFLLLMCFTEVSTCGFYQQ